MIESEFFWHQLWAIGVLCYLITIKNEANKRREATLAIGITIFYVTVRLTYLHSILLFIVPVIFN